MSSFTATSSALSAPSCSRPQLIRSPFQAGSAAPYARRQRRGAAPVQAALDSNVVTAVTQQAVAYVAVLGGEAAITGLGRPGGKGSPGVVPTLVGVGGSLAAAALLQQGGAAAQAGAAVGLVTGAAMLKYMFDRFQACEYSAQEWPGDKAWPAVMGLLSFFILSAFWQVLLASFQ